MARRNKTKEPRPIRPSHTHGAEVATVAGEVAGGILGTAAGPAGTVAGMLVGAATGALAGEVIDREAQRANLHDQELDDEIAISGGDLGRGAVVAQSTPRG